MNTDTKPVDAAKNTLNSAKDAVASAAETAKSKSVNSLIRPKPKSAN
jgi:hypothetical protein